MVRFAATHPLDEFFSTVSKVDKPGVIAKIIENRAMAQVFAKNGKTKAVERALGIKETPGKSTVAKDHTALPLSPGQWLLVSNKVNDKTFFANLTKSLGKNGYASQQSDSRVIFRISGNRARELMIKGCRLDLHPSVASAGWCAQTQMAQAGVILHQVDDKPTYDVWVYSGFAQHFAEWLAHTGAQLGIGFSR